ncbi:NAD(P)H-hydrate epimerase [Candidatus Berkelbacteria bacterium]|nr:NAD(P)H-hydrate epimerase [Candidatus Berkelbacteria bacterium]
MPFNALTPAQFTVLERQCAQELGFSLPVLIETASFAIVEQIKQMLGKLSHQKIVVMAGAGHNGADAIATARRLAHWGSEVTILLAKNREELNVMGHDQLQMAEQFGIRIFDPGALTPPADLVIDGLIGTGLHDTPKSQVAELIQSALKLHVPILALDIPSGLDPTSGKADQPVIRADATVTLGYAKTGLMKPFAKNLVGKLLLADLSFPTSFWQRVGLTPPIFENSPLLEIPL